jgi:hypothetical protein
MGAWLTVRDRGDRWRGRGRWAYCERGDVLLEYVLLLVFVLLPLLGISEAVFDPTGAPFRLDRVGTGEDFGLLGNAFVLKWKMVMCGVGLPLP